MYVQTGSGFEIHLHYILIWVEVGTAQSSFPEFLKFSPTTNNCQMSIIFLNQ